MTINHFITDSTHLTFVFYLECQRNTKFVQCSVRWKFSKAY